MAQHGNVLFEELCFFSNRQPIRSLQQMFPLLLSLLDSGSTCLMLVLMTSLGQNVRLFVNALQYLKNIVFSERLDNLSVTFFVVSNTGRCYNRVSQQFKTDFIAQIIGNLPLLTPFVYLSKQFFYLSNSGWFICLMVIYWNTIITAMKFLFFILEWDAPSW